LTHKNRTLIIESDGRTVARTLQLLLDADMDGRLTPAHIGIQEVDGDIVRFGIDLDGEAASATMEARGNTIAVPNFATGKMGAVPFRMVAVNLKTDGSLDPLRLLADNKEGLDGLLDVYKEFEIGANIGAILDAADRTQVVLLVHTKNGENTYSMVAFSDQQIVDFATREIGEDIEVAMTTPFFGGEFNGITFTPRISYSDMGIRLPARRIAMAPDGTKVVTFADFRDGKAFTATFTANWEMIGDLTEVDGYILRFDGDTATYQEMTGRFGTVPWAIPDTSATDTTDQAAPTA